MVEWEDGQLVQGPYVEINGIQYPVVMPEYTGNTPMTAENLNKMQNDLSDKINEEVNNLDIKIGKLKTNKILWQNAFVMNENQTKLNEATQRAVVAEAKAEAMMLGVKSQYVDDIVTLALAKMTDDSDLKTIIGEFKTKYPVWFGESEEDKDDKGKDTKTKTGQKGTGSSVKSDKDNTKKGDEAKGLGARLAAQRKSSNKKSSYWGK
jgi:hypothetical protein